jgi:hypothetical protein
VRFQVALAAAQYRTGHYEDAKHALSHVAMLTRAGLAVLAMAEERLGLHEQAGLTLDRLHAQPSQAAETTDTVTEALRSECEALLHDHDPN